MNLTIKALMVIPGSLITGIVYVDNVLVENKIPHMTLFHSSKIRPMESNSFLEDIDKNPDLKSAYESCIFNLTKNSTLKT